MSEIEVNEIKTGYSKDIMIHPRLKLACKSDSATITETGETLKIDFTIEDSPFKEIKKHTFTTLINNINKTLKLDSKPVFTDQGNNCIVSISDLPFNDLVKGSEKSLFGTTINNFSLTLHISDAEPLEIELDLVKDYTLNLLAENSNILNIDAPPTFKIGDAKKINLNVGEDLKDYSFTMYIWEADAEGQNLKCRLNDSNKIELQVKKGAKTFHYIPQVFTFEQDRTNPEKFTSSDWKVGIRENKMDVDGIEGGGTEDQYEWSALLMAYKNQPAFTNEFKPLTDFEIAYKDKDTFSISQKPELNRIDCKIEQPDLSRPGVNESKISFEVDFSNIKRIENMENEMFSIVSIDSANGKEKLVNIKSTKTIEQNAGSDNCLFNGEFSIIDQADFNSETCFLFVNISHFFTSIDFCKTSKGKISKYSKQVKREENDLIISTEAEPVNSEIIGWIYPLQINAVEE